MGLLGRFSFVLLVAIGLFAVGCGGGGTSGGSSGGSTTSTAPTITSVTVDCSPTSINTNQTTSCSASVQGTGSYSSAVSWQATDGPITGSGVFTPVNTGTAVITATSKEDSTKSGTASITVVSTTANNEWTWMSGSDMVDATGIYGALGTASTSNVPGARYGSVGWTDRNGNLWLFGGTGYDVSGKGEELNDLWEYTPSTGEWTWMGGSDTIDPAGVYGTLGVASASSTPGARDSAVGWTDSNGNLWLFGGEFCSAIGGYSEACEDFNDLWKFDPTIKEWTWMSGSNTTEASGVYGTKGIASASNVPGARHSAVGWIDGSGNLWLFGGGYSITTSQTGSFNDLWKFSPSTKEWTWMSGSDIANTGAVYGTQQVASTSNVPGARYGAVSWTDSNGNLWLFGGWGFITTSGLQGSLNDLWEFNPSTKEWTWMSGGDTTSALGIYGSQGVASSGNMPGARYSAVSWTDSSGDFWLFGGIGYGSTGTASGTSTNLNDLWEYSPSTKEWEWVSGSNTGNAAGVYGTQGVASTSNVPGARIYAVGWTDPSGNLWLSGGSGLGGVADLFNDLWRYQP